MLIFPVYLLNISSSKYGCAKCNQSCYYLLFPPIVGLCTIQAATAQSPTVSLWWTCFMSVKEKSVFHLLKTRWSSRKEFPSGDFMAWLSLFTPEETLQSLHLVTVLLTEVAHFHQSVTETWNTIKVWYVTLFLHLEVKSLPFIASDH